ncbi:PREDICTED: uncharacterized protein LOC104586105 [Nelumbo nucifera]|uniref:Uncharacterized protein LOC104586105 n=1 Tax=Nelumbo nucifera TaxID=4432 RepID=A0A1U7YUM4_NELNU|nr:PREDICTED: uncharacterized protein LOC104586105 [Nelumbo nucifera]
MESSKDVQMVSSVFLGSADIASGMITTVKLDGTNFFEWSQSTKFTITRRGKLGFITRKEVKPNLEDPKIAKWEQDNSLATSWLICSMQPHIARNYMFLPTAKDIWDRVVATYSQVNNTARVYQLQREACKIDHLKALVWKNPEDGEQYRKYIEDNRVFDFLARLNPEFDFTRQHILSVGVVSLASAYSLVQGEESRRTTMMQPPMIDHSAFMSSQPKQKTSKHPITEKAEDVIYDYCKNQDTLRKGVGS